MLDRIAGSFGGYQPKKVDSAKTNQKETVQAKVGGQTAPVSFEDALKDLSQLGKQVSELSGSIESRLTEISRLQAKKDVAEKIRDHVDVLENMQGDFEEVGDSAANNALSNQFVFEKENIRRFLSESEFNNKPLIQQDKSFEKLLNSESLSEISNLANDVKVRVDSILQDTMKNLEKESESLAQTRVILENLNSVISFDQNAVKEDLGLGDLKDLVQSDSFASVNPNRANILQILSE